MFAVQTNSTRSGACVRVGSSAVPGSDSRSDPETKPAAGERVEHLVAAVLDDPTGGVEADGRRPCGSS